MGRDLHRDLSFAMECADRAMPLYIVPMLLAGLRRAIFAEAYQKDVAERFVAVVRQRDVAEAEVNRLSAELSNLKAEMSADEFH